MGKEQNDKRHADTPAAIYVWLVPSEEVLEQPGSWRIRKWDTAPFPEANFTLSAIRRSDPTIQLVRQAIFHVLDDREWDFENDEQRVDFADAVATWIPAERT